MLAMLVCWCCSKPALAGIIEVDTVWTGDVLVDEKVIVAEEATLLIMPGSRILFATSPEGAQKGGGRLIVFGRLIAQGSTDKPILFTAASLEERAGNWEGLRFEQSGQRFSYMSHCIVEYARSGINGRNSLLQVDHSSFRNNLTGITARGALRGSVFACRFISNEVGLYFEHNDSLKLIDSHFEDNSRVGIVCSNSSPSLDNNRLLNNEETGIACLRGSSPLIKNCLIQGHRQGIRAEMISSPLITYNEIIDNDIAISMERLSFAVIELNTISKNRIGIYFQLGGYPHIHHNNIVGNREYAVDLGTYQSIVVARQTPFERRAERNLQMPSTQNSDADYDDGITSALPRDGLIDAYGNWWGEQSLDELRDAEAGADLSMFEDGNDTAMVMYQGQSYPRDRIGYAGWCETPIAEAVRRPMNYQGVEGQVLNNGMPVPGVRVHVYAASDESMHGEGLAFSAPTGAGGDFNLPLLPGRYRLVVREAGFLLSESKPTSGLTERESYDYPLVVKEEGMTRVNLMSVSTTQ